MFDFDVKADPKLLRDAAVHGEQIQAGVANAVGNLNAQHQGVPGQMEGFEFDRVLLRVLRSWQDRLSDVRKECAEVSQSLRLTADEYEKTDEANAQSFKQQGASAPVVRPASLNSARHDSPFG
ncbi:type VII secretion target [Streptomyces chattanoogensis]|uniref:type VII secretion target n=1 Tax=Streptomyces chattanoogensis TaxID=66876 RepID=UPI000D1492F3|nr:type VII secretion target [Streptomyces chattanoogensis]